MPRTKLTDKQKKKIIADYINNNNYSETAKMNNVSDNTVRRIVNSDEETSKKVEQKKEENTQNLLDYLDSISDKQKEIIDLSLARLKEKLENPDKHKTLYAKDIATVYGIIYDKAIKAKELKLKANSDGNGNQIKHITIINDLPNGDINEIK